MSMFGRGRDGPGQETHNSRVANSTANGHEAWESRARVFLSPVAPPSILGLFGFFGATIMVGTHMAGWWGTGTQNLFIVFPFALMFGGVAQFLAGMWSYRARDAIATAIHGTWGSFWIGYGILYLLYALGVLTPAIPGTSQPAFAMWFVVLAAITMMGALASLGESLGIFGVLSTLATGSGFAAAGLWAGAPWLEVIAGWLFIISAAIAWYVASAMMIRSAFGRTVLPTGELNKAANVPGAKPTHPIEYSEGMPGVKVGQ